MLTVTSPTLIRSGYSVGFQDNPAIAVRRLLALRTECPTALFFIFTAALWSRSSSHPHEQLCQRICSFFGTFSPQLEQSCEVL